MKIDEHPAFAAGKPIAFVYQENNHPPSFQMKRKEGKEFGGTSDLEIFRAEIGEAVKDLVFLTDEEAQKIELIIGEQDSMRGFTQEEINQLMAI